MKGYVDPVLIPFRVLTFFRLRSKFLDDKRIEIMF